MNNWKLSWRWFEVGLFVFTLAAHLYIAFSPANSLMHWFASDDAFYYFKVAVNINAGRGVTFDGVNPTNGFHPLWMLICIPIFSLAKIDLLLPLRVVVLVSSMLGAGSGILLFRLLKKYVLAEIAALVSVVWVFQPLIHQTITMNGLESTISAFCIALFVYLVSSREAEGITERNLVFVGLAGGLAILARLDNVFVVMLLGLWFVLKPFGSYVRNLISSDMAMIFITGVLSYYLRLRVGHFYQQYSASLSWFLILAFVFKPLSFLFFGRYRPDRDASPIRLLFRSALAVTLASLLIAIGQFLLHYSGVIEILPRSLVIVSQIIIIDWMGSLASACASLLFFGWLNSKLAHPAGSTLLSLNSLTGWKPLLQRAVLLYGPIAVLLGGFLTWSYSHTGTFMPVSGQIKHWWGVLPNTIYGAAIQNPYQLFGWDNDLNAWGPFFSYISSLAWWIGKLLNLPASQNLTLGINLAALILLALLLISQYKHLALLVDRMGMPILFLGLYSHIFYYTATSYLPVRSWYWVGEVFFTMLILGIVLDSLRRLIEKVTLGRGGWRVAGLLVAGSVLFSFIWQGVVSNFPYQISTGKEESYLIEVLFLEDVTDPDTLIGMTGGGTPAYFIKGRTIVNMDGLINSPEYFEMLKAGKGALFWDDMGLDYVYARPYVVLESDPYHEMLEGRIKPLVSFNGRTVYKYEINNNNGN
jgi:hypothetical protein